MSKMYFPREAFVYSEDYRLEMSDKVQQVCNTSENNRKTYNVPAISLRIHHFNPESPVPRTIRESALKTMGNICLLDL